MITGRFRRALSCASALLVLAALPAAAQYPYMDDSNANRQPSVDGSVKRLNQGFPRIHSHEMFDGGAEAYSKYQLITAHGTLFTSVERIQSQFSPDTMMLRHISGRAYQQYNYAGCQISGGIAFEATTNTTQGGPSSAGCGVYAGHWLYKAGSRLRQNVSAGDNVLPVDDASRFDAGQYVVIYNAPAGSFNNAEHARVASVNRSNNTIQVNRGFKSNASAHGSGSIVAQHVLGQGTDPQLWAFNMTTQSPRDGAGKTFSQFYADWLGQNLERYGSGQRTTANVAGVLFDADFYQEYARYEVDADNDLVIDSAMGANGQNWLGDGLDQFYARVQQRLPGYYVLVGVHDGRGYDSAYGAQLENWLDYGNGDFTPNPKYAKLSNMIQTYLFNMQERANGPALVTNLTKTPTKLYPGSSKNVPSNAPFRLALATAMIEDGFFGTHSALEGDPWWDEYAVDVRKGSSTFGKAIAKSNTSAVLQNLGWMGAPLGAFQRIYSDSDFSASKSLVGNNTFDNNTTGWASKNVSIGRVTNSVMDGTAALRASQLSSANVGEFNAFINSDALSVTANVAYTLVFSARASAMRDIKVSLGNDSYPLPVSTKWRRYVVTLTPSKSSTTRLKFLLGGENSEFWLDSVYLFKGDANVFKREFENGIALANATAQSRTIQVGSGFRRISGTQDPTVNNGNSVTSVTLGPYDGILLVRENSATAPTTPDPDPAPDPAPPPTSSGGGLIGDLVWRDNDGDGVQDSGEPGWAGATVRLRQCNGDVLATTTTASNGSFAFDKLGTGNYQLEFVTPSGAKPSPYQAGNSSAVNSDANETTGLTWCAKITSANEQRRGLDAGFVPTSSGDGTGGSGSSDKAAGTGNSSIGDYVWNDLNGDGIQNAREPGVAGVRVQLRDCNGLWLAATSTASDGSYLFEDLAAGSYMVRFVAPSGAGFTRTTAGSNGANDSNADSSGNAHCMSIGNNDTRRWIDAGLVY